MSTYEANRDINRAMSSPWHEHYTHAKLIEWYFPNPDYHGSYHWNWTSNDEQAWSDMFKKWQKLIYEFHKRGGHLAYAVDDPYIWNTAGIGNIRELQLMKESGLHALEVIRSATRNSAITLRQPQLGLVQTGFIADLAIINGNPLDNFHYLFVVVHQGQNHIQIQVPLFTPITKGFFTCFSINYFSYFPFVVGFIKTSIFSSAF